MPCATKERHLRAFSRAAVRVMSTQLPISRRDGDELPGYRMRRMKVLWPLSVTRTPKPGTCASMTWYRSSFRAFFRPVIRVGVRFLR